MSEFEKKKIEMELQSFAAKNFERPHACRNLEQIRFYVRELCLKIEEWECRHNYVPTQAYALLAQYNMAQNRLVHRDFVATYC
jgi:hypothetical protein